MTLVRGMLVVWTVLAMLVAVSAGAQSDAGPAGEIDVTVSTQAGTVVLPGVVVTVKTGSGEQLAQEVSDGQGHVTVRGLPPGPHHVSASLDGFDPVERTVTVGASDIV